MKYVIPILLCLALLVIVPPAHSQFSCTPPAEAQLSTVNVTGQYTAWALGNAVTWCSSNGIFTSYEGTYIDILYFDAFWLPYNLYWGYSVDGYLFQMNVATGQGYLLSPHGQPPGDPGEAHMSAVLPVSDPLPTETPAPVVRRPPVKPSVVVRFEVVRVRQ